MKPCPHCQSAPDLLLGGASGASDVCLVFCGSDCSFDTIVAEPASEGGTGVERRGRARACDAFGEECGVITLRVSHVRLRM
jgi:hypothetical protein